MTDPEKLSALKRAHERENRISVGELRERLAAFADDAQISFGAVDEGRTPLVFVRLKNRGPIGEALVCFEFHELTDDAMDDELASAWGRRAVDLRDCILFVAGEEGVPRPTEADTNALGDLVRELKANPTFVDAAAGCTWFADLATNARAARALHTIARWAGRA